VADDTQSDRGLVLLDEWRIVVWVDAALDELEASRIRESIFARLVDWTERAEQQLGEARTRLRVDVEQ
jgi:hypothetical protein